MSFFINKTKSQESFIHRSLKIRISNFRRYRSIHWSEFFIKMLSIQWSYTNTNINTTKEKIIMNLLRNKKQNNRNIPDTSGIHGVIEFPCANNSQWISLKKHVLEYLEHLFHRNQVLISDLWLVILIVNLLHAM